MVQYFHMPPTLVDIEQLHCCKLLGVIFQSNFKMDSHIQFIQCTETVPTQTSASSGSARCSTISYCSCCNCFTSFVCPPCMGRVLVSGTCQQNQCFFTTYAAFCYLQSHITVAELMNKSDHDLFCKLCAPTHALNHLLPPTRNRASLRTRGHSYQLPEYCLSEQCHVPQRALESRQKSA